MWGRSWPLVAALGCLVYACATGSTEDDPSGPTSSSAVTAASVGGMGGGGAGGSATTSMASSGGMGGMDPMCEESPCKLVTPQCGCSDGEKCTLVSGSTRGCVPDGTKGEGELCANDCEAGLQCLNVNDLQTCRRYCTSDEECPAGPGARCVITSSAVDDVAWCTDNCDPITNTNCNTPNAKCTLGLEEGSTNFFTICVPFDGTGTQGNVCDMDSDCDEGHICQDVGGEIRCRAWCDLAAPTCTCVGFDPPAVIGTKTYGVCQ